MKNNFNFDPDKVISKYNFLVVGIVRNCEKTVYRDISRIYNVLNTSKSLHWFIVESDSDDQTKFELVKLKNKIKNFRYKSLGNLRAKMPLRTERMAYCRNKYVAEIKKSNKYKNIDYVIVADLDGINTHLNKNAVASCWINKKKWDMCSANQLGPYYDIWTLRHKDWSPNDCWHQYRFLNLYENNHEKNLQQSVFSRMIKIPVNSEWIAVDSAYGGFAIYKKYLFNFSSHVGLDNLGNQVSDIVDFHIKLKQRGAKLFINPKLINAKYTEHSKNLLFFQTQVRKLRFFFKKILILFFHERNTKKILKNLKFKFRKLYEKNN